MLQAASDLHTLGALAACHVLLIRLFLDVTGHIHVAVGMLRVVGFDIPVGSERPYQSRNVLDFWRRWNTYYRDYVMALAFYPLAVTLKRRPYLAVAAAGAATFLLSGFAHAAQYALRRPEQSSFESFVEGQVWAAIFGSLVVVWMLREAAQGRRRRDHAAGPAEAAPWTGLRGAMAAFVTLSLVSVILLLLHPPLAGQPLATSMSLLAAFLRPPWL
jgi:hypothetical protein